MDNTTPVHGTDYVECKPDFDIFKRIQERVGDLYPQFRGWTVTTLTHDLNYISGGVDSLVQAMEESDDRQATADELIDEMFLPQNSIAVIVQNPGNGTKAVILVDGIHFEQGTRNGPRLGPADLQAAMVGEPYYLVLPGSTTTICVITLVGGNVVYGDSGCIARENFDWELGKKYARENAERAAYKALAAIKLRDMAADRTAIASASLSEATGCH